MANSIKREAGPERGRKLLVFRIGFLGDTLLALPALWAIREQFPTADIHYLSEELSAQSHINPASILPPSGLIDHFFAYRSSSGTRGVWAALKLFGAVRAQKFDALAYLPPSNRTEAAVRRDLRFFRAAGIRKVFGVTSTADVGAPAADFARRRENEAAFLLRCLRQSGIPAPSHVRYDLGLTAEEISAGDTWLAGNLPPAAGGCSLIAIAPGSKRPSTVWRTERYREAVAQLITEPNVWPIVFGGKEDRPKAEGLIAAWRRGAIAAGTLNVRQAAAVLNRCALYLGNDTGTMHLAAAVGVPCVAVFSARNQPGQFEPHGTQHQVLRVRIGCEGCFLDVCPRQNECLNMINVEDVVARCRQTLKSLAR